jgi:hypothetical protein
MMLFKNSAPAGKGCQEFMFDGQELLQNTFVVVALLCIPVLLLGKPIYILCCGRSKSSERVSLFNLLKPSDNFTYHQDQYSKILRGAHIAFICFMWISEQTATFGL